MPRRPMTPEDLWALPRVGAPEPSPDGKRFIVPVTTYDLDENEGTTRLWLDGTRALTTADASSGQVAWSPDGKRIAFVRKHDDMAQVWVMPVDRGGEPERVTDAPLGAVDPHWLPDGRRLVLLVGLYEDAPTIDGTRELHEEREKDPVTANVTEDRYYRYWDRWLTEGRCHHVFVLDLETRALTDLTPRFHCRFPPDEPQGNTVVSPDGREVAFGAVRSGPPHDPLLWGVFTVRVGGKAKRPRDITPASHPSSFDPLYSPDGRWILFKGREDVESWADRGVPVAYDRTARRHVPLAPDWPLFPNECAFAPDGRRVYFAADVEGRTGLFRLGFPHGKRPTELVRGGTLAGLRVRGKRIFAILSTIARPPETVSFGLGGKDRRELTSFTAPLLRELRLAKARDVRFRGADGARVQMWFVPPAAPARKKRRPPLVHLIHGGPHGAFGDQWHWRWNAQVFAARGYAVALVNFHGSTGWGGAFTRSIVGSWGDKPLADVLGATDHLVKKGWVDERRMAAGGGSYGGYLASWIAAKTGDRFRCIVNHAGVCDFQTQVGCDIPHGFFRCTGGNLWDGRESFDRFNPLRHADGFQSPMLILHGEKDYRVPYYQALQIYNVYKARKLPARLVSYPDENHWILKPRNSLHWYAEFLAWLERWLGA